MPLAQLSKAFSHFLCYTTNWALLVLIPGWVVLCMFQDPVGLSKELSCEAGNFSRCLSPHRFLLPEVLRLYFPTLEPWVAWSVSLPVVPPGLSAHKCKTAQSVSRCLAWSSSHHLAKSPLHPGLPSPPLLQVWMNISSLTLWLLDFNTVQFSGSFGYFLFLNLLLSFFWLCKEANCIYLHLHLGLKSSHNLPLTVLPLAAPFSLAHNILSPGN